MKNSGTYCCYCNNNKVDPWSEDRLGIKGKDPSGDDEWLILVCATCCADFSAEEIRNKFYDSIPTL